jgi:hypothetical protein
MYHVHTFSCIYIYCMYMIHTRSWLNIFVCSWYHDIYTFITSGTLPHQISKVSSILQPSISKVLWYQIDNLQYRKISFYIEDVKKSFDIKESLISKIKSSISGLDIKNIWHQSGVLWYLYMIHLILKFTFCISGPISKIPYIKDLKLQYWRTGNWYIVPYIKELWYQRFLHHIGSL